jgi:transcriptional regulator with XRE-family HTH domain
MTNQTTPQPSQASEPPQQGEQVEALEDAAIVCERRDEFGHTHRGTAVGVRAISVAIRDMEQRTNVGESPSGYALVPLEAFNAVVRATSPASQAEHSALAGRQGREPTPAEIVGVPAFDAAAFNEAFRKVTKLRGKTMKEVSAETGVSETTLSRMQQGRKPDAASLATLSAWAGMNPSHFVAFKAQTRLSDRPPEVPLTAPTSEALQSAALAAPDWQHPELQALLRVKARQAIELRMIGEALDAETLEQLDDLYDNDYETCVFMKVKELARTRFATPRAAEVPAQDSGASAEGAVDADDRLLTGQAQHLISALMAHGLLVKSLPEDQYLKLWDVVKRQLRCVNREGARTAQPKEQQ